MKPSWLDLAVVTALIAANLLGTFIGFIYYYQQLSDTDPLLWVFVPDCPLYTGLFAILAFLSLIDVRNDWFGFLVSVGLMKYAAWTLFVLAFYSDYFFSSGIWLQSATLFTLHIGMLLEGFTIPSKRIEGWQVAATLAWFIINDCVDYIGPSVHPYLPSANIAPAMAFALLSTFAFTFLAAWLVRINRRIAIRGLS